MQTAVNTYRIWVALILCSSYFLCFSIQSAVPDNVQAVFANSCLTNCHQGNAASGGLNLDDANISEASLLNVTANCNNNLKLVDPGNPQMSALYIKLFPNPNCGGVMPAGGAPLLSDIDRNVIFDWIVSIGPAAQFGLFSMAATTVDVNEADPQVVLTVNRELGTGGPVMVDFSAATVGTDTAVSPTDYVAQTGTLIFADGETSKDITVILADDDVFEGTEVFSVTLSNPQGGAVLGGAAQTKVSIIDNEFDNQPGTFFFSRVAYSVDENAGSFDVTILRSFGAGGQVMVNLASSDGTAIVNSDYQIVNSDLVFEEGVKNQTITVTILDDGSEEQSESFGLTLSNPANGALLGSPNNVTVTINDNDAPAGNGGGGGGSGGGSGGGAGGSGGGTTTEPAPEVEFTAAGSLGVFTGILMLLLFRRRKGS